MADATDGTGPAAEGTEGGAERHPTDLLGSQGGSQGTGTEPAQPSGDQPPADKPITESKPVGDNAEQGAKTVTDPELPAAVQAALANDPTDGWADDEKPEPDIMAPGQGTSPSRRQTDELNLNGDIKPARRWWIWAIWVIAGIAVSIFISLAVQNGEEEKKPTTKPAVAKQVPAKSDKGKVATTASAEKATSFTVLARRDETLELYAKWVKASVEDVLKWNNIAKSRPLKPDWAVVLYATHENLLSFEESRQKYHVDSSTGQAPPVVDGIKIAVSGGVQSPTDIMVVDPNAPDTVSGASASSASSPTSEPSTSSTATTVSPVEGNTVVTPVTADGAIVPSSAVVGLAAGASEKAVAAEGTADEAVFRVSKLEAKVAELQRKLDEAVKAGAADAEKLRKEFDTAKAELAKARATAPVPPPAPSTPPPVSTGSGATGSSAATHLLVDPAMYLKFCLKYGGTQEGCNSTLKDLQQ